MSGKVWISSVLGNYQLGDKLGTRAKHYGRDWDPASDILPVATEEELAALRKYTSGFPLPRTSFPEASAVFNERKFRRIGNLFACGGFFVVRGKLADVLSRFDLGEGGLIPFPMYEADLITPIEDEFYLINFGARKNSILPELSENVVKFAVDRATGVQHWKVNSWCGDGDVVLSPTALEGPDLWFEEAVYNKIFMKDALVQALSSIGMAEAFDLRECRIMEGAPQQFRGHNTN